MAERIDLGGSTLLAPEEAAGLFPGLARPAPPPPADPLSDAGVIETPARDVLDPERGRTFRIPFGLTDRETQFVIERDGDDKEPKEFLSVFHLPDVLGEIEKGGSLLARGFLSFLVGAKRIPDVLIKEDMERRIQALQRPFGLGDILSQFNPFDVDLTPFDVFAKARGAEGPRIKKTRVLVAAANRAIEHNKQELILRGLTRPETGALLFDIGGAGGSIGAAVTTTLLTRNPAYAAVFFGILQKTSVYEEARAAGFAPKAASRLSSVAGVVEGGLELLGNAIFLRIFGKSRGVKRILLGTLEEVAQEASQQGGEEILTQVSGIREIDIRAGVGRVLYAAAIGGMAGGPVATVAAAIAPVASKEGVSEEVAGLIAAKMVDNAEALQAEAAGIMEGLASDISINPKTRAEVSEIIRKFIAGEEIDIEEVLGRGTTEVATVLAGIVRDAAVKADIGETVVKGRVAELNREIDILDQQIGVLDSQIERREAANKPVKALQNKLDKLARRREAFEEEQADLQLRPKKAGLRPESEQALRKGEVGPKKAVRIRAEILEKLNVSATAASVRAIRKGFREGVRAAKRNIKEAQTVLTTLIDKAGLEAKDKAKFLRTIKNIQSTEQLTKRLPGIQSRVIKLLDSGRRRTLRAALKKTVRKTKPRKVSGKPVGRFGPEVQKVLDRAREILRLPVGEAKAKLETALTEEIVGADAAFENALLAVAARDEGLSADAMEDLLIDLNRVKAEGREAAKRLFTARKEKENEAIAAASRATTQNQDIDTESTTTLIERIAAKLRNTRAEFASWWDGWDEILDKVFNKEGADAGALIKSLRMTRELQDAKAILIEWEQAFEDIGLKAYGLSTQRQLVDRLYQHRGRRDLGTFVDAAGRQVRLEYSIGEAIDLWMKMQNDQTAAVIRHEKGNAFSDEMMRAVFNLLSHEDVAYGRGLLDFYDRTTYPRINTVYRRMFGVDLPKVTAYSPVVRDRGGKPVAVGRDGFGQDRDTFFDDIALRRRLPSALKSRIPNLLPLARQNVTAALHRHVHDLAHFIATGEKARFLNNVFSPSQRDSARLRKEIARRHGEAMLQQIDSMLADFNKGYLARGLIAERQVNLFNRVFSKSVLALKTTIGMKQVTSLFAMGENVPVADFAAGIADFAKRPREVVKFLYLRSTLLQRRGPSLDLELGRINASEDALFAFKRNQSLDNALMVLIRLGDRAPIYAGGWAAFKHARKAVADGGLGLSEAEAIALVEDKIASTQQSVDIDKLSNLQRMGAFGRTMTLFFTSRLALFRGEARAIRQFRRKKISAREFGKRIAYYHFIMPSLVQLIASGFKLDPERQLTALLLGQLNNAVVFGDLLVNAALTIFGGDRFNPQRTIPLFEFFEDATKGAIDVLTAPDFEEFLEAMAELSDEIGKLVGLPVEQTRNIVIGGIMLSEKQTREEGVKRVLGWSPRIAEESSKR